jgi:hypothetical protein
MANPNREPKIPCFAKDLLRESPEQPPPKTREREEFDALAALLGVDVTRPYYDGAGKRDVHRDRETVNVIIDCKNAVKVIMGERDEHKKVTEAIDTVLARFFPVFPGDPWRDSWQKPLYRSRR